MYDLTKLLMEKPGNGFPFPVNFVTFPETSGQISSKQVFVVGVDLISWQISLDLQLFDEFFCTSNLFKAPPGLRHVTLGQQQDSSRGRGFDFLADFVGPPVI